MELLNVCNYNFTPTITESLKIESLSGLGFRVGKKISVPVMQLSEDRTGKTTKEASSIKGYHCSQTTAKIKKISTSFQDHLIPCFLNNL